MLREGVCVSGCCGTRYRTLRGLTQHTLIISVSSGLGSRLSKSGSSAQVATRPVWTSAAHGSLLELPSLLGVFLVIIGSGLPFSSEPRAHGHSQPLETTHGSFPRDPRDFTTWLSGSQTSRSCLSYRQHPGSLYKSSLARASPPSIVSRLMNLAAQEP